MRLRTAARISGIKPIRLVKSYIRRRVIAKGIREWVKLIGGPFDGEKITLQAKTYGTLCFRIGEQIGRYNQKNEWEDAA